MKTQFPGICRAAIELGVTREHLYRVLVGKRQSAELLARFQRWQHKATNNPSPVGYDKAVAGKRVLRDAAPDLVSACKDAENLLDFMMERKAIPSWAVVRATKNLLHAALDKAGYYEKP